MSNCLYPLLINWITLADNKTGIKFAEKKKKWTAQMSYRTGFMLHGTCTDIVSTEVESTM